MTHDTESKHNVNKKLYDSYARSGFYGDGTRFYACTAALLRRIQESREDYAFRKLLSETIGFTMYLKKLPAYLKDFSYSTTYDTLKIIDNFLIHSGAMHTLIEQHNKMDPTFREIDHNKLFDIPPAKPREVIGIDKRFPEYESDATPLDTLLLLGNTIFYSNKAAKFIEAVEHKMHKHLKIADNPFESTQIIDKFCRIPEVSEYIKLCSSEKPDIADVNEKIDKIIEVINSGTVDSALAPLAKDRTALIKTIEFRIARQSLYNIKNLSVIQLVEKCNEWNTAALRESRKKKENYSLIKYSLNPRENGIYFHLPYTNMPIGVHLHDHLFRDIRRSLTHGQYETVNQKPSAPTVLLLSLENQDIAKKINYIYYTQSSKRGIEGVDNYIRGLKENLDSSMDL